MSVYVYVCELRVDIFGYKGDCGLVKNENRMEMVCYGKDMGEKGNKKERKREYKL